MKIKEKKTSTKVPMITLEIKNMRSKMKNQTYKKLQLKN
jgi:hypothetical protein